MMSNIYLGNIHSCSILSAEFVRAAIHDARAVDSAIVSKIKTHTSSTMNGLEEVRPFFFRHIQF